MPQSQRTTGALEGQCLHGLCDSWLTVESLSRNKMGMDELVSHHRLLGLMALPLTFCLEAGAQCKWVTLEVSGQACDSIISALP